MKALILSLATARLTQLVVDDKITAPAREAVLTRAQGGPNPRALNEVEANQPWSALDEIVNCHACTSIWAGAGILTAEQTSVGRFLVRVLALSQAALAVKSVIERIDR